MDADKSVHIRKRMLPPAGTTEVPPSGTPLEVNEIDLGASATVLYSAEDADNPVEHLFDRRSGRGAPRWTSGRPNVTEEIVIEFDRPQDLARLIFEAEERFEERTQEVTIEFSTDGGRSYRRYLVQEYTFSPHGATFQKEDLSLEARGTTHVRLLVRPDKRGSGIASLTSLRLFR